jgi:RNA polymerase sigma factor (sigma-70 family)
MVYIVDDRRPMRQSVARLVRSAGLRAETFPSARAFFGHKARAFPACLVLSVRLPGHSGLDLQAVVGTSERSMPDICVTSRGSVSMTVRATTGGALDFLQKPCHSQDLLDAIQRALAKSHEARQAELERSAVEQRLTTLTRREREVLRLVVKGLLNKQVGAELGVTVKTVKTHRGRVMKKMQAASLAALVRMAQALGLDAPPG